MRGEGKENSNEWCMSATARRFHKRWKALPLSQKEGRLPATLDASGFVSKLAPAAKIRLGKRTVDSEGYKHQSLAPRVGGQSLEWTGSSKHQQALQSYRSLGSDTKRATTSASCHTLYHATILHTCVGSLAMAHPFIALR